jgi:hypothetical protein
LNKKRNEESHPNILPTLLLSELLRCSVLLCSAQCPEHFS